MENSLRAFGLNDFVADPLPSDASMRKYYRVRIEGGGNSAVSRGLLKDHSNTKKQCSLDNKVSTQLANSFDFELLINNEFPSQSFDNKRADTYILMDCTLEQLSIPKFLKVQKILRENKVRVPYIFAFNENHCLLEDFGDTTVAKFLANTNTDRISFYRSIIDLLLSVQEIKHGLETYTKEILLEELEVFDWYILWSKGKKIDTELKKDFFNIWHKILDRDSQFEDAIVLRDFHVENLMFLECGSIGVLDFQDALIGNPIYDLVSLLTDARIDVSLDVAEKTIEHYCFQTSHSQQSVSSWYHILGAQRNLRILGTFARKALKNQNSRYLSLIPRVLGYLEYNLNHDDLRHLLQIKKYIL